MPDRVKFSAIAPRGHVRINSGARSLSVNNSTAVIVGGKVDDSLAAGVMLIIVGPETITGYNVTALHLLTSASTVHHLTVNVNINYSRVIQQGPASQFLDVEYKMSRSWGRRWKINVKGIGSAVFDTMDPRNTGTGGSFSTARNN
ncbi:hypothetical protein OIU79_005851 [Salix purpurea]|uniref:Uncharacterized protein n=1 Tax=Salix purpurea TaxID=77065 RepID=A0A9Q0TU36_SALPP|nr:hypothetical protein OIU79_005851 [Salix purpurea]